MADTLAPVTHDRLASTLEAMNLQYYRDEDGDIRTAFPALAVFFQVEKEGFKASTRWMATLTAREDIEKARLVANKLNQSLPLVRVHPVLRDDLTCVIVIEAPFFTREGVTDDQLTQMLDFYFTVINHVGAAMHGSFPDVEEITPDDSDPKEA